MALIKHLPARRTGGSVAAALLLGLSLVPACRAEPPPTRAQDTVAAATAGTTSHAAAAHLQHLAETGRFDEVLTRLKSDYVAFQTPPVTDLIHALEAFDESESKRNQAREDEFAKALEKVRTELAADNSEEALIAAIDAHSLASNPQDVLTDEAVKSAVGQAEARARSAEDKGDWVEALSMYRALDLLYDDYATYRNDVKRVAKHVQVLQLYVPNKLRELYEAQAARRAERKKADEAKDAAEGGEQAAAAEGDAAKPEGKEAEPPIIETDAWQTRLKDVDTSMLRQTLAQAARQHVETAGYAPLVRGALDSLLVMLDTPDLAAEFPSFNNADALEKYRTRLQELRKTVEGENVNLNFIETAQLITEVLELNQQTLKLPEAVVVYELTEGATSTLDDFSAVIWPAEREQFSRSTQGKFYGVGIQISRRDGRLIVVTPLPETPAQKAGIKAGDIIATVNGHDTASWSLDRAVREITGPEGTGVKLGIERLQDGEKSITDVELKRAEIAIESIRGWEHANADGPGSTGGWNYWIDPEARIGYVRMSQFIPQTAEDLDRAVAALQQDGPVNGLILDLRFNPGGLLSSAVDVVDRFIEDGPIVYTVDATGQKTQQTRASKAETYPEFPLVVLVNQGSASASEIVSGALQDYGRALIVGTRSFGKGSVQDLFQLRDGQAFLKLTTQYYMLPLGRIIHRKPDAKEWGVVPDLVVEMTNQQVADSLEYRQEVDVLRDPEAKPAEGKELPTAEGILAKALDPQLSAALLVLRTRQVAGQLAGAQGQAQAAKPEPVVVP